MARIITADDDIYLQRIYYYMLDSLGHDVTVCCNGQEAVAEFVKNGADLVILDISMPIMTGLDACREIKQLPQGVNTPVIIVSGNDTENEITSGFNAGADDYMVKPIQENVLVAKLKNFLKTSSLHRNEFELVHHHTVLLDRYRIAKVLGYGAHSVVFLATDQQENRQVAVKLLNERVSDEATRRRFVEIVSQYRKIKHPNIVEIFDYGVLNNQIYIIMSYAPNGNLRQRLTTHRFSEEEVCNLGLHMVRALQELESRDLPHLDLKPENIIVSGDQYKLTDFGLILTRESGTMPLQAEIWSTAAYICPEYLAETSPPTIKSDIYSLGVTMFETVAGDNPFFSGRPTVSMFRQVNLIPPYLSNQAEQISFELSDVIAAMMSKNPDDRPDLDALEQWFGFILECHLNNSTAAHLKYPRQGECKQLVAAQESAIKKRRFNVLQPPRKKSKVERLVNRLGQLVYNFIMLEEHRGLAGKVTLAGKLGYSLLVLLTFTYLSYSAVAAFRFNPGKKENAPYCRTKCTKCENMEDRQVKNIQKESCSLCRKPMGYAMKCLSCKRNFAWFKPDIPVDASEKNKASILKKSMTCPYCKSADAAVVPPTKTEPTATPPKTEPTGKKEKK